MDFESPDVMKDFPGLYASESKKGTNDSDYSDETDKVTKKDILIGKRKDKKDKKDKERGYAALEGESSAEEEFSLRSPSKSKKTKSFKFTSKSKEKREKSREKDKEAIDKRKDKKIDKKVDKEKIKADKKDRKLKQSFEENLEASYELPVFGVSLDVAVERSRCHDGVNLPLPVRECIDHVEMHGLQMEGVYKISGTKSKVLHLKKMYNHRENVHFTDYDIPTVTSLLKQFFRDLPEPIFTNELLIRFEEAGAILNLATREKHLKILFDNLPANNKLLLSWLMTHLCNVVLHEKYNKMSRQHLVTALSPTFRISNRLMNALLHHTQGLFPQFKITTYVPPLTSTAQLPVDLEMIEVELKKQESLLTQIHSEMNVGFILKHREEQLWEGQRIITQLKRRLKSAQKDKELPDKPKDTVEEITIERSTPSINANKESSNSIKVEPKDTTKNTKSCSPITTALDENDGHIAVDEVDDKTVEKPDGCVTEKINEAVTNERLEEPNGKTVEKVDREEEQFMLLKIKNDALNELKNSLLRQIINEQQEIKTLTAQLHTVEKPVAVLNSESSNFDEIMDFLQKENQILHIKKIDLVRQIMEQREICIDLRAKLEVTSKL